MTMAAASGCWMIDDFIGRWPNLASYRLGGRPADSTRIHGVVDLA
jgi:hypothetical protein